jgi:hypothetical protein
MKDVTHEDKVRFLIAHWLAPGLLSCRRFETRFGRPPDSDNVEDKSWLTRFLPLSPALEDVGWVANHLPPKLVEEGSTSAEQCLPKIEAALAKVAS